MIIANGNCTITATGEALSFLKKQSELYNSHRVDIELHDIGTIVIGDTLNVDKMYFKVDKIAGNKVYGYTIINGE